MRTWRAGSGPAAAAGRAGAGVGLPPADPSRATTRSTISRMRRSWSGGRVGTSGLHVAPRAVDLDGVDDRHDGRVHRTVLGDPGLPRRAARRVEDDLAQPGADGIGGDDRRARRLAVEVARLHHEELEPLELRLLARGDDGPHHDPHLHGYFPSLASFCRPSGSTRSMLACGRGITCTETSSPTRSAARWPASVAAFTAATSPRTIAALSPSRPPRRSSRSRPARPSRP